METEAIELDLDVTSTFAGLLVRVQNQTPPEWNVTITAITLDFVYNDGTNGNTTKNTNLGSGSHTILQSNDKCVYSHAIALRVEYDGKTEVLTKSYNGTHGKCQVRNDIILGRKLMLADETGQPSDETRFELR